MYEAESQTIVASSGDQTTTNSEAGYSNGQAIQYSAVSAGDYITFRLANISAGTYDVVVGYKSYTSRGIVQISAGTAGGALTNVGSPFDEYGSSSYTSGDLGNWTATTTGSQDFKFAVTGHNASSTGYTITIDYIKLTPTSGGGGTTSNVAPSGTAYGWSANTSSTSNSNRVTQPGLNDNNLTADVDLDSAGDAINAWEGAGVVWSSAQTISSASFINGTVTTGGDGFLTANCTLQYSTDGSTWNNTGWTISPSYPNSSSASGQTYSASGTAISGVLGMRFVGQVRTTDTSYHWIVKEVQFVGTSGSGATNFTITASAGSGGSISPAGSVSVAQGANQTFSIAANSGYTISSVSVDGVNQGAISSYTFANVQAAHTISAAFTAVSTSFTITASAGANGSISPSGSVSVAQGANQTFAIAANSGYQISSVTVDGASVAVTSSYTFSNVQANHTISAAFSVINTTPVTYEAESQTIAATSGDTYSTNTETGYSNSQAIQYNGAGAGDYITFRLANISAGTYDVVVGYKAYTTRAVVQVAAGTAGGSLTNVGGPLDEYGSSSYTSADLGNWTAATAGSQDFNFAITGHNASSTGYTITIDYIKLTPATGGSTVATPTFSPAGGSYSSAQSVSISTTTSGASIRYTTDGSTPSSTAGTLYSGPISISATTTVNAIAYESGMTTSSVASATYTISSGTTNYTPAQILAGVQAHSTSATQVNTLPHINTMTRAMNVNVYQVSSGVFAYTSSMAIDTDGSDPDPDPDHQSTTTWTDDNGAYLGAHHVPYYVLGDNCYDNTSPCPHFYYAEHNITGLQFALIFYNGNVIGAVFGDTQSTDVTSTSNNDARELGEASVDSAYLLGIPDSGTTGGVSNGVTVVIFSGSNWVVHGTNTTLQANAQAMVQKALNTLGTAWGM